MQYYIAMQILQDLIYLHFLRINVAKHLLKRVCELWWIFLAECLKQFNFLSDVKDCTDPNPCDGNATCTELPGSFSCQCKSGYTGNGTYCSGIY